MKLTKEECLRLLNQIRYALDYHEVDESLYDNVEALEQLINEHFELVEEHEKLKRMLKTFK